MLGSWSSVVIVFELGGWDVAELAVEAAVVEPFHPRKRCQFDVLEIEFHRRRPAEDRHGDLGQSGVRNPRDPRVYRRELSARRDLPRRRVDRFGRFLDPAHHLAQLVHRRVRVFLQPTERPRVITINLAAQVALRHRVEY